MTIVSLNREALRQEAYVLFYYRQPEDNEELKKVKHKTETTNTITGPLTTVMTAVTTTYVQVVKEDVIVGGLFEG